MLKTNTITSLFCFLLLISTTAFSQTNGFQVLNETKVLGKNYITGADIVGTELKFPDRIHDYFVDTTNHFLTVQLRGIKKNNSSGDILQYNLKNEQILWTKKIDYEKCRLLKFGNLLILNAHNECYGLDAKTGASTWGVNTPVRLYIANPEKNIGAAYILHEKEGYTNELMGIDLLHGEPIWIRDINREYGWNDYLYINDSTLVVVAAGLHTINLYSGEGWDYNTVTGKVIPVTSLDPGFMIMTGFFGLVGGLVYGAIASNKDIVETSNDITRDLVSNALTDTAFFYLASQEQLVKLDKHTGEIIWKYPFKKNLASKSSLFMNDDMVYMINYGFAFRNDGQIYCGKPFIAAFDKQTGEQKYFSLLKKGVIIDYQIIGNELYLLFSNLIIKLNLETGAQITKKLYSKESLTQLIHFAENKMFIMDKNGDLWNPVQNDPINLYVNTNQRKIISFDNQLKVTNTIGYKEAYSSFLHYKDYQFIANSEKTFVINNDGKIIAELNVTSNAFLLNNILYDKRDKSFVAIDLKNIGF